MFKYAFLSLSLLFLLTPELKSQPEIGLIYFLPSDRTAQADVDTHIDTHVKAVQTLYADRMQAAGDYGRKTFTFETNTDGTAKVYHITGEQTDAYYDDANKWEIWNEIRAAGYEADEKIYMAFIDLSSGNIDGWCGTGGDWLVNFENDNVVWRDTGGGVVTLTASGTCFNGEYGKHITAHELGHALGLRHLSDLPTAADFAVGRDPMLTSDCSLEWLDGHLYFNSGLSTSSGDTSIELATPYFLGSDLVLDFTITDADGLHQAGLFRFVDVTWADRDLNLVGCQSLSGSPATVTFRTTLVTSENNTVALRVIDGVGRSMEQHFSIDFTALATPQKSEAKTSKSPAQAEVAKSDVDAKRDVDVNSNVDVNGDGLVNILDLVIVANALGKDAPDLNGDGIVNILDLALVAHHLQ